MAAVLYQFGLFDRLFSLFLRQCEGLHCPVEIQQQMTLEKVIMNNFVCVSTEIPLCLEISSFCIPSVN